MRRDTLMWILLPTMSARELHWKRRKPCKLCWLQVDWAHQPDPRALRRHHGHSQHCCTIICMMATHLESQQCLCEFSVADLWCQLTWWHSYQPLIRTILATGGHTGNYWHGVDWRLHNFNLSCFCFQVHWWQCTSCCVASHCTICRRSGEACSNKFQNNKAGKLDTCRSTKCPL